MEMKRVGHDRRLWCNNLRLGADMVRAVLTFTDGSETDWSAGLSAL